jgi:hypothetical protein
MSLFALVPGLVQAVEKRKTLVAAEENACCWQFHPVADCEQIPLFHPMPSQVVNRFPSQFEAARHVNVGYSTSISSTCSGKQRSAHGFYWRFLEGPGKSFYGGKGRNLAKQENVAQGVRDTFPSPSPSHVNQLPQPLTTDGGIRHPPKLENQVTIPLRVIPFLTILNMRVFTTLKARFGLASRSGLRHFLLPHC